MDPVSGSIVVSVPARPEFIGVLRSFAAVVASELRLSLDDIDDLRLAIDEAFTSLLGASASATTSVVTFVPAPQELIVTIGIDAGPTLWPPRDVEGSLAWQVISGLVDRAEMERGPDGRPTIVIVKKTLDAAPA